MVLSTQLTLVCLIHYLIFQLVLREVKGVCFATKNYTVAQYARFYM